VGNTKRSWSKLKAREIIKTLGISHPTQVEIEDIAWIRGALVKEERLEGSEGRLVRQKNRGIISVKADIRELGKRRFVIAHELGHFELHKELGPIMVCTDDDMLFWRQKRRPQEEEANIFAAELLMPEELFSSKSKCSDPSLGLIEQLASEFKVSLTATALRYIAFSPYRCTLVISENKKIKWYKATKDFNYYLKTGIDLHRYSVAIDFFEGKTLAQKIESVFANAWIQGENLDSNAMIKEYSKALPSYNAVMTLLWIDEDIDGFYSEDEEVIPKYDSDHFTPDGKRWRW